MLFVVFLMLSAKLIKKCGTPSMFSVKKPKMSGDAWKCIGRCSKIHWGAFGKNSGGFLKNLGTFLFSHTVRKYK